MHAKRRNFFPVRWIFPATITIECMFELSMGPTSLVTCIDVYIDSPCHSIVNTFDHEKYRRLVRTYTKFFLYKRAKLSTYEFDNRISQKQIYFDIFNTNIDMTSIWIRTVYVLTDLLYNAVIISCRHFDGFAFLCREINKYSIYLQILIMDDRTINIRAQNGWQIA